MCWIFEDSYATCGHMTLQFRPSDICPEFASNPVACEMMAEKIGDREVRLMVRVGGK
jgi:hypothetical protein